MLGDETAKVHRLIKVPLSELEAWDAEHDVLGQRIVGARVSRTPSEDEHTDNAEKKEV